MSAAFGKLLESLRVKRANITDLSGVREVASDDSLRLRATSIMQSSSGGIRRTTFPPQESQTAEVALTDDDQTLTALLHFVVRVLASTPSQARTWTFPTAAGIVFIFGLNLDAQTPPALRDSMDFSIINLASNAAFTITLGGTPDGITYIGSMIIAGAASGLFRIVLTNVTAGSETVSVMRIA